MLSCVCREVYEPQGQKALKSYSKNLLHNGEGAQHSAGRQIAWGIGSDQETKAGLANRVAEVFKSGGSLQVQSQPGLHSGLHGETQSQSKTKK